MKKTSRRNFLSTSAAAGVGTMLLSSSATKLFAAEKKQSPLPMTGFEQDPLAYKYNELEPSIDAMTMEIHYTKHAAAYCKNLKEAAIAEKVDVTKPVEDVLKNISKFSTKMRNNAGGHYNHELFWKTLSPKTGSAGDKLLEVINRDFGSFDAFKTQFTDAAKARFGSGWAWLIVKDDKKLAICSTPNQDNPLMDIAETKGTPVFGLDVWEHAYYLHYQNKRADYIENFWKVLNWDYVTQRYNSL